MEGWRGRRGGESLSERWVGIPESSLLALVAGAETTGGDEVDMTVVLH
jgi:hypothetical protein